MALQPKKLVAGMTKEQLATWRVETMGLNQKQAAEALGMTENAYRAMEKGTAKVSKRTRLACLVLFVGEDKLAAPWLH